MSIRPVRKKRAQQPQDSRQMIWSPQNYRLFGLAVMLLAIGFAGMYIENEFKGWFSLYVSPLLLVAGFITVVFGVMKKFPQETDAPSTP